MRTNKRVLVVDDDRSLRELLMMAIEAEGYDVAGARDGLEALDKVAAWSPRLILLDLMMPRLDGAGFAAELERRGLRPTIPILVMSANLGMRHVCAQLRAEGCVAKPFELGQVLEEVAHMAA